MNFGPRFKIGNGSEVVCNEPKRLQVLQDEPKRLQVLQDEPKRLQVLQDEPKRLQVLQDEPKRFASFAFLAHPLGSKSKTGLASLKSEGQLSPSPFHHQMSPQLQNFQMAPLGLFLKLGL